MVFTIVAAVFGLLEIWQVFGEGESGGSVMPPVLRIIGPLLLALSALQFKGRDRLGMLLTAVLFFAFFGREWFPNPWLASLTVWLVCAALATLGAQAESSIRPWVLLVGFATAVGTLFLVLWLY